MEPRLLVYKLAAIFHDPVWKPWVISASFGGKGRVFAKVVDEEEPAAARLCRNFVRSINVEASAHVLDAAATVLNVLEPLDENLAHSVKNLVLDKGSVVANADRFAAALDRWVLAYREEELKNIKVDARKARYVNPLDPRFSYEPMSPRGPEPLCNFVRELRGLVESLQGLPLPVIYNALLFSLEPLWYKHCNGCVPLADTRTPTHTVFDHIYAAASMVNWLHGNDVNGFIVKLDIAGIQEFISAARKTRDLWAGSWLVSALAWYTVAEAAMLLGADIVLSPYPLANHFFIATLLREIYQRLGEREPSRLNEALARTLQNLEELARKAFLWSGAANQPIVPGTFFIALPCLGREEKEQFLAYARRMYTVSEESARKLLNALAACDEETLREYFVERFREAWQRVARAVERAYGSRDIGDLAQLLEKINAIDGWSPEDARRIMEEAMKKPPLRLRVMVLDVAKEYRKLREKVLGEIERARRLLQEGTSEPSKLVKVIEEAGVSTADAEELTRKLLFHHLFSKAIPQHEEETLEKVLSVEPGYDMASVLERVTSEAFSSNSVEAPGFHECSICGRLPSVAYIGEEALRALRERRGGVSIPPSMFSLGERLCPYCLIRRLLTLGEALEQVMESLNLYKNPLAEGYPRVPATSELSALSEYIKLIKTLLLSHTLLEKLYKLLESKLGNKLLERAKKIVIAPLRAYAVYEAYQCKDECKDRLDQLLSVLGALEAYYDLSELVASGAISDERECRNVIGSGDGEELCSELVEIARSAGITGKRYYVIVRGDGDMFGSCIVAGILEYEKPEDYVAKLLENGIMDKDARSTLNRYYGRFARLLVKLISVVDDLEEEPTILVTPSYYVALSRGQMITALYDALIISMLAGFPVYAGGDDVAALMPGNIVLDTEIPGMERSRKRLSKEDVLNLVNVLHNNIVSKLITPKGTPSIPIYSSLISEVNDLSKNARTFSLASVAVILTRRNYWGLLGPAPGFHVAPIGSVYAAPVAYGRSYGVYVAHYRDPFQAVWRAAGELEELKDSVTLCKSSERGLCSRKDLVLLYYGRASGVTMLGVMEPVVLPNLVPCNTKNELLAGKEGIKLVARTLENTTKLLGHLGRDVSQSIIYDFERESTTAKALAERMKNGNPWVTEMTRKLVTMTAKRNTTPGNEKAITTLLTYCDNAYSLGKHNDLPSFPLSWQLVRALKVLSAANR